MVDKSSEAIPAEQPAAVERSSAAWRRFGYGLRSLTPSDVFRSIMVLAAVILVVWLAAKTWPALLPFAVGGMIAYVLLPVVNFLDRVLPRFLASFLAVIILFGFVVAFLSSFTPLLFRQIDILFSQLPSEAELAEIAGDVEGWIDQLPPPIERTLTNAIDRLTENARANVDLFVSNLLGTAVQRLLGLFNALGFILGFLVIPTWLLTVLNEQKQAGRALQKALPGRMQADFWAILQIIDRPFRAFFTGQIFIGLCIGVMYYLQILLLDALGFPGARYPILLSIFVGLTALIPELGVWIGLTPALLVIPSGSTDLAIGHVIMVFVAYFIVGRLVTPHIERRMYSIHPAILILVIVALSELSLVWVLLAAPVAAAATDLFRYLYGRVGDPAAPAGLLPATAGRPVQVRLPVPPPKTASGAAQPVPLVYRRNQATGATASQQMPPES